MQQALRPYATAGVAIVGASLIAMTPMAPRLPDTFTVRDIKLVSGEATLPDIAAPWIDQFNTASENATTLLNTFYDAPYIGLQQAIANQSGLWQGILDDPTTINSAMQEMQANLDSVLTGYGLQNPDPATLSTVIAHTLDASSPTQFVSHTLLFNEIGSFLPPTVDPSTVTPIVDFLASPESGIIMGDLGPMLSPWIALDNSITAGDDFNETLANMVGALFNGATLNLDSLAPLINSADIFPQGMAMQGLSVAFGGLLSPGDTAAGVGGSIFNSLGVDFNGVPVLGKIDLTGQAIGPIGAWEAWGQTIADLLGWDGSGSPLADITLPTIPADLLGGGASAATAATDLSSLIQDILSAF